MTIKFRYEICASGCDDETTVILVLTEREARVIRKVAEAITEESSYECMPTMSIERLTDDEEENEEETEVEIKPVYGKTYEPPLRKFSVVNAVKKLKEI